ncbi:MAG: hypothetical protein Q9213_003318 [Squamulea squamosa]
MGRERRRWTAEEDSLLREAVRKVVADVQSKATRESRPLLWRELAKNVPERTNKDCRRRWCNILSDGTAKGSWAESEDERLSNAVREHGPKWTRVAAAVGTRNSDQCSSHWSLSLNPDIDYSDWTRVEDEKLLQAVKDHGTNWTMIVSTTLSNRTTLALKNRYSALRTKVLQMRDAPKSQPKPGANANHAKRRASRSNANPHTLVHTMTQEVVDHSDEDEDEDENEEEDEDYNEEPNWNAGAEGRPLASPKMMQEPAQDTSCPSPSNGMQQVMDLDTAAIEFWFQNPSMSASTFAPGSAPEGYRGGFADTSTLHGMEIDFGSFPNPGVSSEMYSDQEPYCPGVPSSDISRPSMAAGYPAFDQMPDALMSGVTYATHFGQDHPTATEQDVTAQLHGSEFRRESATQQDSGALQYQGVTSQAATSPDTSNEGSKLFRVTPSPSQITSPSERLQGPLHQVSVDAECTTDQLGSLMRTLVGTTNKVVVKIHS